MTSIEQAARDEAEALDYAIRIVVSELRVEYRPLHELISLIQESVLAAGFHSAEYLLSDESVEEAARILHQEFCLTRIYEGEGDDERIVGITPWDWLSDESRKRYETAARAALRAVLSEGEPS